VREEREKEGERRREGRVYSLFKRGVVMEWTNWSRFFFASASSCNSIEYGVVCVQDPGSLSAVAECGQSS